ARREHPGRKIIATGCAATLAPQVYAGLADVVLDNEAKLRVESYALGFSLDGGAQGGGDRGAGAVRRSPQPQPSPTEGEGEGARGRPSEPRARAYLQVQQGCDHRCTFCIIPFARGPSRSVPIGAV